MSDFGRATNLFNTQTLASLGHTHSQLSTDSKLFHQATALLSIRFFSTTLANAANSPQNYHILFHMTFLYAMLDDVTTN